MGPWSNSDWAREKGIQAVNHIYFGASISTYYQKEIKNEFFTAVLKRTENQIYVKLQFLIPVKSNRNHLMPGHQKK